MRTGIVFIFAAICFLSGCMLPRPVVQSDYTAGCIKSASIFDSGALLFATERLPDCRNTAQPQMTAYRSGQLWYGAIDPAGVVRFYSPDKWWHELRTRIATSNHGPIVYIHGYNNDPLVPLSTARAIGKAVGQDRVVIAYTWPSYASLGKYFWDEANAEWAMKGSRELLTALAENRSDIILIAHSMGNRLALDTVGSLRATYHSPRIKELIMASPDVDRQVVYNQLMAGIGAPVTLYGSTRDQALSASWRSHGYARAGDFSAWVPGHTPDYSWSVIPGVNVVDTSLVSRDMIHHRDFISTSEGAADLCRVIRGDHPEVGREKVPAKSGVWRLIPGMKDDECGKASAQPRAGRGDRRDRP